MIFVKLARREIKNNLRYWLFFSLNLTIGLIGFCSIYLFKDTVSATLEMKSKTLLSSDIAISGRRALADKEKQQVDKYLKDKITQRTSLLSLYSMGKVQGKKSRLVFVKSIESRYPLIGQIKLKDGRVFDSEFVESLQVNPLIVISREISHQLKIGKGDSFELGQQRFQVEGIIQSDSTSSMRGVNLAPKVYIGRNFLKKTGLVAFGTVAWYSDFFLLRPDTDKSLVEIQDHLQSLITDPAIKVKTPKNSSEQIGRVIGYLSDYLGLIGVIALLISTVGAAYLFQSYLFDRLKQIGILKSLGLGHWQIAGIFISTIVFFGFVSSVVTLLGAHFILPIGLNYLKQWMSGDFNTQLSLEVFFVVIVIGVIANLFVCLPVLFKILKNKTSHLLNSEVSESFGLKDYLLYLPVILFLWGISIWQAQSVKIGSLFTLSLIFIFAIVLFAFPQVLKVIDKSLNGRLIAQPLSFSIGFALRLLSRSRFSTVLTVLSLSVGVSLVSVIGQIDSSLKSELTESKTAKPSLFMFDIQESQYEDLLSLSKQENIPLIGPTPMVRARLLKKNGEKIKRIKKENGFVTREDERKRRFNNRGVNLSYAQKLNSSEEIVAGKEFSGSYSGEGLAEVSLEKRYADRLGVSLGDTLTYEVLGVEVRGKIVNLRKVRWTSFLPNFFIIFQPGVLEEAPKTYLAAVESVDFERQLTIQDLIVEKFGNISILNVTEIIQKILSLFKAMAIAVGIMSVCCIFVGLFVLYSILQSQIHKKQKDLALQKIVGMKQKEIFKTLLVEYLLMTIFSLIIGNLVGSGIAYLVSYFFLDGVFVYNYSFALSFNLFIIVMTLIIISFSYKNNYKRKIGDLLLSA
ncbi:MAG: FtsX-like permease family protein [Bacteriovoracaceae bacterium]|jgi:putative ABC transport system permease protein|nr:FtsX-like permease family protein [Bacteriovoracaceae bacterium]